MDIRRTCIYELPMNGVSLKYASGQKYATTRGTKSILVISDTPPNVKHSVWRAGKEFTEREARWAYASIAEIVRESDDMDAKQRIGGFLDRLEKELEKRKKAGG